ncbi:holo-ACP synthase [Corynebacterium xerosis]|nr:holo-ACP synthase [Corynebacterium xerosis]
MESAAGRRAESAAADGLEDGADAIRGSGATVGAAFDDAIADSATVGAAFDDAIADSATADAAIVGAVEGSILGTGIDMVHVPSFAADLDRPGSTFAQAAFTVGERAAANRRGLAGAALARHLAGRWAVKEAVVKAWSQALYGTPPVIPRDEVDWREIEVVADAWGRVAVALHGRVRDEVARTVGAPAPGAAPGAASGGFATPTGPPQVRFHVSISHDGDQAIAIAVLAGH